MGEEEGTRPDSLLPYDDWTEEALRLVAVRAISHAAEQGLPGDHHFYLTFRTDFEGAILPPRLRAQYPQEMTIILQHQFWDLKVDDDSFSVGLSFGGVPTTLTVPFAALTAFADPHVRYGLRFSVAEATPPPDRLPAPSGAPSGAPAGAPAGGPSGAPAGAPAGAAGGDREGGSPDAKTAEPQVVSLDAFRRRPTSKE